MIYEAEMGESKYEFFKRTYDRSGENTYVFNDVRIQIDDNTPEFVLVGRLHDAICRIQQLESQYRR
jgi:hypothetical protein